MKDAKGHGSDARGGAAHQQGVNALGQAARLSPAALDVIQHNPLGFSVTLEGAQPTEGFMVAVPGHAKVLDADELRRNPGVANEWASQRGDLLRSEGMHVGGWTNPDEHKVYLEPAQNVKDQATAERLGRERGQRSIWDVKNQREIVTGEKAAT